MDADDQSQWTEKQKWALCQEPYRSDLQRMSDAWIAGDFSNEELAFQIVQMQSELAWVHQPHATVKPLPVDDALGQLRILAEAMLQASESPNQSPLVKRQALDQSRARFATKQK